MDWGGFFGGGEWTHSEYMLESAEFFVGSVWIKGRERN